MSGSRKNLCMDQPPEVASLWLKYSTGQIGSFDFARAVETIKNRQTAKLPEMEI